VKHEDQLIDLGNGFYADDKDNMYFRPTEFLRSNGLPVKKRLMQMVLEEVQQLDPGIQIVEDPPSRLLD
jgi:hypothetical protein